MAKKVKVTTNLGKIVFDLHCPQCGEDMWEDIPNFEAWRKCNRCGFETKIDKTPERYLMLVVLKEDHKRVG